MCLNCNISCSLPLMLFNFEYNELILDLFKLLISNFVRGPRYRNSGNRAWQGCHVRCELKLTAEDPKISSSWWSWQSLCFIFPLLPAVLVIKCRSQRLWVMRSAIWIHPFVIAISFHVQIDCTCNEKLNWQFNICRYLLATACKRENQKISLH